MLGRQYLHFAANERTPAVRNNFNNYTTHKSLSMHNVVFSAPDGMVSLHIQASGQVKNNLNDTLGSAITLQRLLH